MSTASRFRRLIRLGEKILDDRTSEYWHKKETVVDSGSGKRIPKEYDYLVHDQTKQRSRFRGGSGWQRGFN